MPITLVLGNCAATCYRCYAALINKTPEYPNPEPQRP